jgi:hypothetical protein
MKKSLFMYGALVLTIASVVIYSAMTEATCTGSKDCNACKNCKYCKHCAKNDGTCGVCK